MPFLLNLNTREINEIYDYPHSSQDWVSININAKRLVSHSEHDIEWEYFPASGILNRSTGQLIMNNRDDVFDVEYYTREGKLNWTFGGPSQIKW